MSETQRAPAPVHSVTVGGVQITSAMSPIERHNAVAAAHGLPTVARPAGLTFGPRQGGDETPAAPGTIAGKAPPPYPATLEASRRAEIDAIAVDVATRHGAPDAPAAPTPVGQIDPEVKAALDGLFRTAYAKATTDADRAHVREVYESDLRSFYEGRQFGESMQAFNTRKAQAAPAAAPAAVQQYTPAAMDAAATAAAKAADKDGFVPAEKIGKELLYGYTLPQDRAYAVADLVAGLRLARAGNVTQAQLTAMLAAGFES